MGGAQQSRSFSKIDIELAKDLYHYAYRSIALAQRKMDSERHATANGRGVQVPGRIKRATALGSDGFVRAVKWNLRNHV